MSATVSQEVIDQVNQMLQTGFEVPAEKLVPTAQLGPDLGMDSLDAVDMLVYLEERLTSVRTLQDVYELAAESVAKSNLQPQASQ